MPLLAGRGTGEFRWGIGRPQCGSGPGRSGFMKCNIPLDYTIWIVYGKSQQDSLQYYSLFIQVVVWRAGRIGYLKYKLSVLSQNKGR